MWLLLKPVSPLDHLSTSTAESGKFTMQRTRSKAAAVLLAASFTALGSTGAAFADTTNGDGGVLSGNQAHAPVSVPINVCGNAVAVLGQAVAAGECSASVHNHGGGEHTSGKGGVGSGNQVDAPISAPVNVCGNSVAVAGKAAAKAKCRARVHNHGGGEHTSGKGGVGSGNQVHAPISAPVNACGNTVSVAGKAKAGSDCKGRSHNHHPGHQHGQPPEHHHHGQPPEHHHHGQPPEQHQAQPPKVQHPKPHAESPSARQAKPSHEQPAAPVSSPSMAPPKAGGGHHGGGGAEVANEGQALPFTGMNAGALIAIAFGVLAAGAATIFAARRFRPARR